MKEPDREEDEVVYGLVMPFVCCVSQGGPMDDRSFTAGVALGAADAELKACRGAAVWTTAIMPGMEAQYDLLAMRHGYVMSAEPWDEHPNDWVLVSFMRPTQKTDDDEAAAD